MIKTIKGSITIFASISMMLIAGFLFMLLEAARANEVQKIASMNTASVVESIFAGYEKPLWDMYRILAVGKKGTDIEAELQALEDDMLTLSNENVKPVAINNIWYGTNHLQMEVSDVQIQQYQLLSDCDGWVYQAAVATYMENNFLLEAAKLLYSQYEAMKEMQETTSDCEISEDMALDAVESQEIDENIEINTDLISQSENVEPIYLDYNPLEIVKLEKSKGILNILAMNPSELSLAYTNKKDLLSHRTLCEGTRQSDKEIHWYNQMLFSLYLDTYFSNYLNPIEGHAFAYEQEYILFGEDSDIENLKKTANLLLATREAANLAYLATDTDKKKTVEGIAIAIAGESCNPIIVKVVQVALMAAWAYAESVLDVRALMDGKRVALLKDDTTWSSDIEHLQEVFSDQLTAKESKFGVTYDNYLQLFLMTKTQKQLSYRAMDMQEQSVRKQPGYEDFCMDHLIIEASVGIEYQYHTIFLGMDQLTQGRESYFSIRNQYRYSYWKAGE